MKVAILLSLAAACCAAPTPNFVVQQQHVPFTSQYVAPFAYQTPYTGSNIIYSSNIIPQSNFYSSSNLIPATYLAAPSHNYFPVKYSAPTSFVPTPYIATPKVATTYTAAIEPGYVAKTRGVEHRAPLPEGLGYASHHINLQPAPGTV